jgi:3-dehydroquinate synthase
LEVEKTSAVRVDLDRHSYEIRIGSGTLPSVGRFLSEVTKATHAIVVTDANVDRAHGATVIDAVHGAGIRADRLVVSAGEPSKSMECLSGLWNQMLDVGADRKSVVIALGGGVVGDLAGFLAASFARGLTFLQVPTTLLAQVDSSVGGKVGINLPRAKNMVGAFWQPCGVLIDTNVLDSLPDREYQAGLAEVVKYGVILDAEFFGYLEAHCPELNRRDGDVLRYVISRCCRLKADVVENDEREETGLRAVLNYGHTFCHAFEATTGYHRLLHGEAVSIGMLCASRLAELMGRVDADFTRRQHELLDSLGLPLVPPEVDRELVLAAMQRDKKVEHGRLRFVLPTRMGHVELVSDVDPQLVRRALEPSS